MKFKKHDTKWGDWATYKAEAEKQNILIAEILLIRNMVYYFR